MSAELTEYRVTFGVQYAHEPHPTFADADPAGWLAVLAPDEVSARILVCDRLGKAWAFIYTPGRPGYPEIGRYFPHGQIDQWSTENPGRWQPRDAETVEPNRDIDTMNRQLVGALAGHVIVQLQPFMPLTPDKARVHAAWLVAVAETIDPDGVPFDQVLEAVRNT